LLGLSRITRRYLSEIERGKLMIKVLVSGALGKMGQEVVKAVSSQDDMQVVAGVDPIATAPINGITMYQDLNEALSKTEVDVVVDFTEPTQVLKNIQICLEKNVRVVVGTTGISDQDLVLLQEQSSDKDWAGIIAPNFAIGAVLMMRFAQEAAKFFPDVEIIEYHHQQKKDAPSGTAIKTAEMISQVQVNQKQKEDPTIQIIPGARGGRFDNINIHSVRLPGYVAHQEVIFGLPGQNLIIRHDSTHRESFMPGVLLAVRKVKDLQGIIYGLEHILFD